MTRNKKGCLIILVLYVVGLAFLVARALIDAPPPNDADLRVIYEPVPDEENAHTYFTLAAEKVWWPEEQEERLPIAGLLKDDSWDQALADDVLERNVEALDLIERGLACTRYQRPEVTGPESALPQLAGLRKAARLMALHSKILFRQGKEAEAFDAALGIVKLGQMEQAGHGGVMDYVTALAIKIIGRGQIARMLEATALDPEALASYIPRLRSLGGAEEGLAGVFKVEYRVDCGYVDMTYRGESSALRRWFYIKPNKTKRRFARHFRKLIADIPKHHADVEPLVVSEQLTTTQKIGAWLDGDLDGASMYAELMRVYDGRLHAVKCRENFSAAGIQVLVALKCYQLEHGELPDSLDALVPEYFDAVPLDDFDGRPMRYSREKRVIYSVGDDLIDSGGADETSRDPKEPTFKIEF
jgi:hypothetical protein